MHCISSDKVDKVFNSQQFFSLNCTLIHPTHLTNLVEEMLVILLTLLLLGISPDLLFVKSLRKASTQ